MSNALGLPGGPAFPVSIQGCGDNGCAGMSLRDWFAGLAMQSIAARDERYIKDYWPEVVAHGAYEIADAMLKARGIERATSRRSDTEAWDGGRLG